MAIHPEFRRTARGWDTAALDIRVPDDLTDQSDRQDWQTYLKSVPLAKLLSKFAESLDQLHSGWRSLDRDRAGDAEKIRVYSKWEAAEIASGVIAERVTFEPWPASGSPKSESNIGVVLSDVFNFMTSISASSRLDWRDRVATHILFDEDEKFDALIADIRRDYVNRTPPPGYKDPGFA